MSWFAVDVGYGFVKGAADNGRRCLFPSVFAPRTGAGELATALGGRAPEHGLAVAEASNDGNGRWWVGNAALAAGGVRAWETEASRRQGYDLLALAAIAVLGGSGLVSVALGLPLQVFLDREERRALRRRLEGYGAWISLDGTDGRYVQLSQVRVFPQGLGAYAAHVANSSGSLPGGRVVGVVDVGYRTTDFLLLQPSSNGSVPDEARSGSIDTGVGQAYETVRANLQRETGLMIPAGMVEQAMAENGSLPIRGKEHPLQALFSEAARAVASRIEAELRRAWADRIDFMGAILLAGGGGATLATHLLGLPGARVVPDAVHANALGFLTLAHQVGQPPNR